MTSAQTRLLFALSVCLVPATCQFATVTTNSAGRTGTLTPTPIPTVDAWFMNNLRNGLKEFLDSIYPAISAIETLTLPNTIIVDGSPYRIPAIALQTTTVHSSSTSVSSSRLSTSASPTSAVPNIASSTRSTSTTDVSTSAPAPSSSALNNAQAANDTKAALNTHDDKRLAIILGAVFGAVILALLLVILCLVRRRKKRSGYWLKHRRPSDEFKGPAGNSESNNDDNIWDGNAHHSTSIWSTGQKFPNAASGYAPVGSPTLKSPEMATSPSRLPLLAGLLSGRRRAQERGDDKDARRGNWTPPQHESVDAVAADGPFARAANAQSDTNRHSYYDDPAINPVPNPYELSRPKSTLQTGPLTPVVEEQASFSNASNDEPAASYRRPSTPLMHDAFGGVASSDRGTSAGTPFSMDHESERVRAGSITGSTHSSIMRKPVPPPIRTNVLQEANSSNPFASPADTYTGPFYGNRMHSRHANHYVDQRGDDFESGRAPILPIRSPERRQSPRSTSFSSSDAARLNFSLPRGA